MNVHKGRKSITQRPFRILADCERIYLFLIEIYERDWRNGVPAPFFEYAYASFSYRMDISYSFKNLIRECNGEIVAFCFYENPGSFSLSPFLSRFSAYPPKNFPYPLLFFCCLCRDTDSSLHCSRYQYSYQSPFLYPLRLKSRKTDFYYHPVDRF